MTDLLIKAKPIFARACTLQGSAREAYLESACRAPEIRREVESLLAEHEKPDSIFKHLSTLSQTVISHYEIGERVGEGGISLVYRAYDTKLHRWVALKFLHVWTRADPRSRDRLLQEARAASRLNHPHIVTIHEVDEQNGVSFIVMELISGRTLNQMIPGKGLPVDRALHYAAQIADALAMAHSAGILHGDLKPLNVMVTEYDHIKLLDFGLAKALAAAGRAPGKSHNYPGTEAYMAPEQLGRPRRPPAIRSEIFSFGLLLHQMLGGGHAFGNDGDIVHAIRKKKPQPLPAVVPDAVVEIVLRCLEKKPARRFATFDEVLQGLRRQLPTRTTKKSRLLLLTSPEQGAKKPARPNLAIAADLEELKQALEDVGYQNLAQSRLLLREAKRLLVHQSPSATRAVLNPVLRNVILSTGSDDGAIGPARQLRKLAFDLIREVNGGNLSRCFGNADLEYLDLYGLNFRAAQLAARSFNRCFLVESDFGGSNLKGASFAGACIRNVNFSKANLSGADLADADWFNALGLKEAQLRAVRPEGLLECPPDVAAMRQFLSARYAVPFEAWSLKIQRDLVDAWDVYLRPKGLAHHVKRRAGFR